jgi:hypothetical protein
MGAVAASTILVSLCATQIRWPSAAGTSAGGPSAGGASGAGRSAGGASGAGASGKQEDGWPWGPQRPWDDMVPHVRGELR